LFPDFDCDPDPDLDADNAVQAALSGSPTKATGFACGYLLGVQKSRGTLALCLIGL